MPVSESRSAQVLLQKARDLQAAGEDEAAKAAYVEALRLDPANYAALCELGTLAGSTGFRSAAQTAYLQAVRLQPENPVGRVNLGNLYYQSGELQEAREQYEAALRSDAGCIAAHQGLARTLEQLGEPQAAERHWREGFVGHAVVSQRYRGTGPPVRVLLLLSTRLGNVATAHFLDDRTFAVTAVHVDAFHPHESLPAHDVVFNAIGDADLCAEALGQAQALLGRTDRGVINPPSRVLSTDRLHNAQRLGRIDAVIAPRMRRFDPAADSSLDDLRYPLLLRAPGFHLGRHFMSAAG